MNTTMKEYYEYEHDKNPHKNVDKEIHAKAMRKRGMKNQLANEKSQQRHTGKILHKENALNKMKNK